MRTLFIRFGQLWAQRDPRPSRSLERPNPNLERIWRRDQASPNLDGFAVGVLEEMSRKLTKASTHVRNRLQSLCSASYGRSSRTFLVQFDLLCCCCCFAFLPRPRPVQNVFHGVLPRPSLAPRRVPFTLPPDIHSRPISASVGITSTRRESAELTHMADKDDPEAHSHSVYGLLLAYESLST